MSRHQKKAKQTSSLRSAAEDGEYLSPNMIGRELGITGVAVKQWIYQRRLKATKLPNGYWRVSRCDLDVFLAERRGGGRIRVLLVGEQAARMADAVEEAGWSITAARNPIDAVLRALDIKPSLAVIDIASLGEGGWAAARKLRDMRATVRIPMLLLVSAEAHANSAVMERAVELGAQGCLSLPTTSAQLMGAARELLGS